MTTPSRNLNQYIDAVDKVLFHDEPADGEEQYRQHHGQPYVNSDGEWVTGRDLKAPEWKRESNPTIMLGQAIIALTVLMVAAIGWAAYAAWPLIKMLMWW